MSSEFQAREIAPANGIPPSLEEELATSLRLHFDRAVFDRLDRLPPPDEDHLEVWRSWTEQAQQEGAFAVLSRHLPQLAFPIREGMSQNPDYRAATLQGRDPAGIAAATGLELEKPEAIELSIYDSAAGAIPLLIVRSRPEFVALVRALGKRNENTPIPDSMGALMLAGFNNWFRVGKLRRAHEAKSAEEGKPSSWAAEFSRLKDAKHLYQDRFILLSDGPYSAVPAAELGLGEATWRAKSLLIRRDHECAHYTTRRLFAAMKNHLHDELIADYSGIVAAEGHFKADWFLRFIGLDGEEARPGARALIYRCEPPLSDAAFEIFCGHVRKAARHVEAFDHQFFGLEGLRSLPDRLTGLVALASLRLDEMAEPSAVERLILAATDARPAIARKLAGRS